MSRELFILRHAKSSWTSDADTDFDRPLAKRGKRDAPRMGGWMKDQGLIPDYIVSSPANRAQKTCKLVCKELGVVKSCITWDESIYAADLEELLDVLTGCPRKAKRVLLVGHNPGLDMLLSYLWGDDLELPDDGNLVPT
ncbi:MAG: histidine phosphatase family protein, partial [Gammaproteobacteria bacterium]|nr:histidine phosphatase family protein [Gammaproteobacteria bacterium]